MVLADSLRADARQRIADQAGDPVLASFLDGLIRNAALEDIQRFTPEELAALGGFVLARAKARTAAAVFLVDALPGFARKETVLVAINSDAPFLFDSLMGEVAAQGLSIRAVFHPIILIQDQATSIIVVVLDPVLDEERRQSLLQGAEATFAQVRLAVQDWHAMQDALSAAVGELKSGRPGAPEDHESEALAFLEWLADDHFTFLGSRDYAYSSENGGVLNPVEGSGLGVRAHSGRFSLTRNAAGREVQ